MRLSWYTRHQLLSGFRAALRPGAGARAEGMFQVIVARPELGSLFADRAREEALRAAVQTWVEAMPETQRAPYLIDALAAWGELTWTERPPPSEGPIVLPAALREELRARCEALWAASIDEHDDDPEASEYADLVRETIDRLAVDHDAVALRIVEPFGDRTWNEVVDGAAFSSTEDVLRFLTRTLGITWA